MKINVNHLTLAQSKRLMAALRDHVRAIISPLHDYSSWDWSKRNKDLAEEHGVAPSYVSLKRKLLKKPRVTKHWPACKKWDWSKPDTAIAREHRVLLGVVQRYRKRLNKPASPRDRTAESVDLPPVVRRGYDYSNVDWNLTDIEIARSLGCSRENVRQVRAARGLPKRLSHEVRYETFCETFKGATELAYRDASTRMNMPYITFRKYCAKAGIAVVAGKGGRPARTPWKIINWDLPNVLLEEIWRTNRVAQRRSDLQLGKPKFYSNSGRIPDEFKAIVDAERQKASEYFNLSSP